MADCALEFSFSSMEKEIRNFRTLAKRFVTKDTYEKTICAWLDELRSIKDGPGDKVYEWKISTKRPIKTVLTRAYERGGKGRHEVFGQLSSIWEIHTNSSKKYKNVFRLVGKASTAVTIVESDSERELARWRFEVGDACAPGCHFHVQILGREEDEVFPKSLSVPRLPGFLVTPMDALEFLLAELFQEEWDMSMARRSDPCLLWCGCQGMRLSRILRWQSDQFQSGGGRSWTYLKCQKPPSNLLMGE